MKRNKKQKPKKEGKLFSVERESNIWQGNGGRKRRERKRGKRENEKKMRRKIKKR